MILLFLFREFILLLVIQKYELFLIENITLKNGVMCIKLKYNIIILQNSNRYQLIIYIDHLIL